MFASMTLAAGCSNAGSALPPPGAAVSSNSIRSASADVKIRSFADLPIYSGYYAPAAVASMSGNLWVATDIDQDFGACAVVQISTSGKARNTFYYSGLSTQGASFQDMTPGSDGALWLTDIYNEQILRLTTTGSYTSFRLPDYAAAYGIASGPDKALWFTFSSATKGPGIGRITTSGKIKIYSVSSSAQDIAAGPDGALWFTQPSANEIGRITTRGKGMEYSNGISGGAEPFDVTAGPDGAMWFTEFETSGSYLIHDSKIGRITTHGKISEYSKGLNASAEPTAIVVGPDSRLWFTETNVDRTGRVAL
jgi:streptogramin lyase